MTSQCLKGCGLPKFIVRDHPASYPGMCERRPRPLYVGQATLNSNTIHVFIPMQRKRNLSRDNTYKVSYKILRLRRDLNSDLWIQSPKC